MYVRFVSGTNKQKPNTQHGVITELRKLRDSGKLEKYQVDIINEMFDWFNETLECPPFESSNWSPEAISWFKHDATPYIAKIREVTALLEDNGHHVRMLKTNKPGKILYEDEFQIVSESKYY